MQKSVLTTHFHVLLVEFLCSRCRLNSSAVEYVSCRVSEQTLLAWAQVARVHELSLSDYINVHGRGPLGIPLVPS
jgi:hypothetical protein